MSTATVPRVIPVSERLLRREAVEVAIADLRLEGLAPTADARLLFERFVQGDLTDERLLSAILAR
jgi:antitoxin VbhA-like protein